MENKCCEKMKTKIVMQLILFGGEEEVCEYCGTVIGGDSKCSSRLKAEKAVANPR